jgi:hypothetical protein
MSAIFSPPKPPKIPIPAPLPPDPAIAAAEREKALLDRRRRIQAGTTRTAGSALGAGAPINRPRLAPGKKSRLGE